MRAGSSAGRRRGGQRRAGGDGEHDDPEQGLPGAAAGEDGVADEHEHRPERGQQRRSEDDGVDGHEVGGGVTEPPR